MLKSVQITMFIITLLFLSACTSFNRISITFNTEGGTPIERIIYDGENPITAPFEPNKEGYTFSGWFEDKDKTIPYTFNPHPSKSLTLYAKWTVNQYFIYFNTNTTINLEPLIFDYNSEIILPTELEREHHIFEGWYLDALFDQPFETATMPANDLYLHAKWTYIPHGLAIMHIDLPNTRLVDVTRETYVNAFVSISNTQDDHILHATLAEFRGRGQGSWTYDKKGYRIKFESRQSVFGQPANRHWVLVAGGHDRSAVRTHAAYTIVNEVLDGIEYQTSVHLIELYVNGSYHGVYSLFEHVRVDQHRVNIDSKFGVLDTGYFIEYNSYASGIEGIDFFRVPGLKYPFEVKSPDPDDYALHITETQYRAQVTFIRNYMVSIFNAVFTHDFQTLETLVDIPSMVDMYIIHELFKNTDTGWSSFYMYKKPSGKLYFGPAWDFDFTAGISRGDSSYVGLYVSDRILNSSAFTSSELYIELMKQPAFVQLVKARYLAISHLIEGQIHEIFDDIAKYEEAFERDGQRWFINRHWKTEQAFVKQWLLNRNQWLKNWAES
jgi:uncharacterized repeat protein (TIGR02543 family)